MSRTNFDQLLEAGCHFGHMKRKWNPAMAPYIFMERNGIHIIDLHKTVAKIDDAAEAVKQIAKSGKKILFVATKKQAKELLSKYDAVILAVGAKEPRDINVPGREGNNILFAVDYLTQVTKSLLNSEFKDGQYPNAKGKNVLVIGGGDTGNDCVGTAIRHGAKSVLQLEMMSEPPLVRADSNPWPEWPLVKKTDYGQEENIAVFGEDPRVYNSTVKEFILDSKGNVKQAVIVKLQTVVKDGRRSFEQVPGSEKTVPCDLVLIAAGFIGAQKPVINAFGVELDARNTIKCDENDHHTNISKLYSAGDVRRGQSLVVWAIREGRDVAKQVDFDLMGYTGL